MTIILFDKEKKHSILQSPHLMAQIHNTGFKQGKNRKSQRNHNKHDDGWMIQTSDKMILIYA